MMLTACTHPLALALASTSTLKRKQVTANCASVFSVWWREEFPVDPVCPAESLWWGSGLVRDFVESVLCALLLLVLLVLLLLLLLLLLIPLA